MQIYTFLMSLLFCLFCSCEVHLCFRLGIHKANVTIIERTDRNIWDVYTQAQQPLDNVTIDSITESMLIATRDKLNDDQLTVIESVLEEVIEVANQKP